MNLNKLTIIFIGFLDVLAIGIFVPTLPDLAKYFSVSAHNMSFALVAYAFFSFIAGPILGQLSDIYGRKKIMFLCILGTVISNLIMTLTSVFSLFLLSRVINGITGGNISVISSMMSDISKDKKERMNNMGVIGSLFGLGFIIGPFIGGLLLPIGLKAPFWFMTVASIIELFLLIFFLKETNGHKIIKKLNYNPFSSISKYIKDPNVSIFLISFFVLSLSFSLYQGMTPLFLEKEFHLAGYLTGYIYSGIGLVIAFNQGFLIKRFWLKKFKLKTLFFLVNIGIFILFFILFFMKDLTLFLSFFFLLVLLQGVVGPIYQSEIVENATLHDRGEMMGVLGSLQSVTMFLGPLFAGYCIDKNISMYGFGAILTFINIFIVVRLVNKIKEVTSTKNIG